MTGSSDADDDAQPVFARNFERSPGEVASLTPLIRSMLAPNPSPFTYHGTNSYIVGRGKVAIIDPGPDDATHVARLIDATRGETVTHIVVTHTHRDHSPATRALAAATGALIVGCAPYAARQDESGFMKLDASHDTAYAPTKILQSGEAISAPGWTLIALATPGHAANHLCFTLPEERALFSGDHVMAWSTSIVAPPDGVMTDYMASLDKLRGRDETVYWPGHGGPVTDPQRFVRGLINHRRQRERAILKRLAEGDRTIGEIVPILYAGVATALHPAAGLSVLAHLIDLTGRGVVVADGAATLDAQYRLA